MLLPILGVLVLISMPVIAVLVSRRDRRKEQESASPEIAETPIDWGAGSALPNGAIRTEPLFPDHPENCTRCKLQARNISAA